MKEEDMETKTRNIRKEDFTPPFEAWIEINGDTIPSSITFAGFDDKVSLQAMFPHKEVAATEKDAKLSVLFK